MSQADRRRWQPYMEPYRDMLWLVGADDVEALTDSDEGVQAQVDLLRQLYERGELGALREREELRAAVARVRALTTSRLGAGRQIQAHCERGDSAAVIFYAGAALMLAHVRRALGEPEPPATPDPDGCAVRLPKHRHCRHGHTEDCPNPGECPLIEVSP